MGRRLAQIGFLVFAIILYGGCAKPNRFSRADIAKNNQGETEFLREAVKLIDRELDLANKALKAKGHADTKELAHQVFEKQTTLRDQIARLSKSRGIELDETSLNQDFSNTKDAETFLSTLIDDRQQLINAFEYQFRDGQSSDLRNLAGNTLPSLKKDLREANLIWQAQRSAYIGTEPAGASPRKLQGN